MNLNRFGGWLNYPDYFFFWTYHGQNAVFNTMNYQNPEMDTLIDERALRRPTREVRGKRQGLHRHRLRRSAAHSALPAQLDVAMQKNIDGYAYWFHRQLDYRRDDQDVRASAPRAMRSGHAEPAAGGCCRSALRAWCGVIVITFVLTRALPGDPGGVFRGPHGRRGVDRAGPRGSSGSTAAAASSSSSTWATCRSGDLGQSLSTGQPVVDRDRHTAAGVAGADLARPGAGRRRRACPWASSRRPARDPGSTISAGCSRRRACRCRRSLPACC